MKIIFVLLIAGAALMPLAASADTIKINCVLHSKHIESANDPVKNEISVNFSYHHRDHSAVMIIDGERKIANVHKGQSGVSFIVFEEDGGVSTTSVSTENSVAHFSTRLTKDSVNETFMTGNCHTQIIDDKSER